MRERGRVAAAFLTTMSALWRSDTVGSRRAAAADPRGHYREEEDDYLSENPLTSFSFSLLFFIIKPADFSYLFAALKQFTNL